MILNACVKNSIMVNETVCRECTDKNCRHAGEPTTREKIDRATYGTAAYWNGEKDEGN